MSAKSQDRYSRFNGAPAAAIGIYQSPGSNAVASEKLDSRVSMVEPAQDRKRDNVPAPFDRACAGCVLPERNMRSRRIVISSVFRKNSSKVLCVEDDQMIRALAADRSDQAFNISVLPGRAE